MKTLTLKVPDSLHPENASDAPTRNLSNSEIVRERLRRKPARGRKGAGVSLWNQMENLVIQTDSLPADLSSNKSHLKAYGRPRPHR